MVRPVEGRHCCQHHLAEPSQAAGLAPVLNSERLPIGTAGRFLGIIPIGAGWPAGLHPRFMGPLRIIENTTTQTRVESIPGDRSRVREELPLSMRVHELAKELGMKSQELLDRIQKEGLDVKLSALASLDPGMVERIRSLIKQSVAGRDARGSSPATMPGAGLAPGSAVGVGSPVRGGGEPARPAVLGPRPAVSAPPHTAAVQGPGQAPSPLRAAVPTPGPATEARAGAAPEPSGPSLATTQRLVPGSSPSGLSRPAAPGSPSEGTAPPSPGRPGQAPPSPSGRPGGFERPGSRPAGGPLLGAHAAWAHRRWPAPRLVGTFVARSAPRATAVTILRGTRRPGFPTDESGPVHVAGRRPHHDPSR